MKANLRSKKHSILLLSSKIVNSGNSCFTISMKYFYLTQLLYFYKGVAFEIASAGKGIGFESDSSKGASVV